MADTLPLSGRPNINIVSLEHDTRPAVERPAAHRRYVNADYFRALGIPIIAGRTFRDTDRAQHVVILSARTAEALWPGQPPLGRRLHTGDTDAPLARVIGITADTRTIDLLEVDPLMVYEPYWVVSDTDVAFALRAGMPGSTEPRAPRVAVIRRAGRPSLFHLQRAERIVPITNMRGSKRLNQRLKGPADQGVSWRPTDHERRGAHQRPR